ncbi:MAG: hypothetical protein ACJA1L_000007 [Paracoccaceae bacterium]|jgi:hypothetical protein
MGPRSMLKRIGSLMIDAFVWLLVGFWRSMGWFNTGVNAATAAWEWWRAAFGVSDVLERPDASTLAARAAGHAFVGDAFLKAAIALGAPAWAALAGLSALYAAWEIWQRATDPDRHRRRVARRWDMAIDWLAVQLGGWGAAAAALNHANGAAFLSLATIILVLGSTGIMTRNATRRTETDR